MWKSKNNKIHIEDAESPDEDELLVDLQRSPSSKITAFDIENPNHRKKMTKRLSETSERANLRQLNQRADDGTSLGMSWWETINPCRQDPYMPTL